MPWDLTPRAALLVAGGAVVGALLRWALSAALSRGFPTGTLLVNAVGSFLLAFLVFGGLAGGWLSEPLRLFLGVGLLGAFTTMSAFAYDTIAYLEAGDMRLAVLNVLANPVLSLGSAGAGWWAARGIWGSAVS